MALEVGQSFKRTSKGLRFEDDVLTKSQMLQATDDDFETGYAVIDKDTLEQYVYNANATPSAETGKFVKSSGSGGGGETPNIEQVLTQGDTANKKRIKIQDDTPQDKKYFSVMDQYHLGVEQQSKETNGLMIDSGIHPGYLRLEKYNNGSGGEMIDEYTVNLHSYDATTSSYKPKVTMTENVKKAFKDALEINDGGIQVTTLPTASATEEGNIYQYVGATDSNYTNGYFYQCQEISPATDPKTYEWVQKNVQSSSGGGSLPSGGTTGQALVKKSNADGDVEWKSITEMTGTFPKITLTNLSYSDGMGTTYVRGDVDGITSENDLYGKIFEMKIPNTVDLVYEDEIPVNFDTVREISLVSGGVLIGNYYIMNLSGGVISYAWDYDTKIIVKFKEWKNTNGTTAKGFWDVNSEFPREIGNYSFNNLYSLDVSSWDTVNVNTIRTYFNDYYKVNELKVTNSTWTASRNGPSIYVYDLTNFTEPDSTIYKRQTATCTLMFRAPDGSYFTRKLNLQKNANYFITQGVVPVDGAYVETGLPLKGAVKSYQFEGCTQAGQQGCVLGAFSTTSVRFTVRVLGSSNKIQVCIPQLNEITSTEANIDFTKMFTCTISYNNGTPKVTLAQDGKTFTKNLTGWNNDMVDNNILFLIGNETPTASYNNGVIKSVTLSMQGTGYLNMAPFMYEGEVVFVDKNSPSVNAIRRAKVGHFEVYNPNATV